MSFQNYTTTVPNPPNLPSVDVSAMQTNTASIANLIAVDHFGFNNNNGGWHKQVTLPSFSGSTPATSAAIGALYVKTDSGGQQALWFIRDGNAATNVQLTTSKITAPISATNGVTFLPGSLLLQWGTVSTTGIVSGPFSFPTTFSSAPYSVVLTAITNSANTYAYISGGASSFSISRTGSGVVSVNYIAIGPA